VPVRINRAGSLLTMFFANEAVVDFESAKRSDTERFGAYFREMLERGVFLAPSQFEAMFVSAAHSDDDIERTIEAAEAALALVR